MNNNNEYVVLPNLVSMKVEDYTLYSKNWDYQVKSGVNLFIGVNGLGKTTSTSLIVYGLVGETTVFNNDKEEFKFIFDKKSVEQKFKIDSNYFKNREFEEERNESASIELEFYLKKQLIKIRRKLFINEIISFEIDGKVQDIDYSEFILEKTKLSKLSDLAFILEKFLVKEEEGNYLLWDAQEQSRILQLLLSPVGFKDIYQKKLNDLSKITTIEKQASYSKIKSLRKQIEIFKSKKKNDENKKYNIDNLKKENGALDKIIKDLSTEREKIFSTWNENKIQILKIDSQLQNLNFELAEDSNKLSSLESTFYHKVYTDEKINTALHKLNSYGICIYCDEKVGQAKQESINQKLKQNSCPVCDSELDKKQQDNQKENEPSEKILNEISELEKHIENKRKAFELLTTQRSRLKDLNLVELTSEIDKQIEIKKQEKFKLTVSIDDIETKKGVTYWDALIHELEEQIQVIELETEMKINEVVDDGDLETISKDIRELNNQLTNIVKSNLESLNKIFEDLSEQYFKSDGKLVTQSKLITKTNNFGEIEQEVYAPFFDKKERLTIKGLSTSERLFLEYIFRLSLLKLYEENSKNKTFMIMETSEGSFDFEQTKKLAELFMSFNTDDNTLILILNLSKQDFIVELNNYVKSDDRILKFFEFGRFKNPNQKVDFEVKLKEWTSHVN